MLATVLCRTPGKSVRPPLTVKSLEEPPTPAAATTANYVQNYVQKWTTLFCAVSYHQQPTAHLNQEHSTDTSLPNVANSKNFRSGIGRRRW